MFNEHIQNQMQDIIKQASSKQRLAMNPTSSVVVEASAGSGKTYVLIRRILALLVSGALKRPSDLLAVTYTKAAASEMLERLQHALAAWVRLDQQSLEADLRNILGRAPTEEEQVRARTLFAAALDDGRGFELVTVHGFCQSLLARFPLEAGLTPGFSVLEPDEQNRLLSEAMYSVLAAPEKAGIAGWMQGVLTARRAESTLTDLFMAFIEKRRRFQNLYARHGSKIFDELRSQLNLPPSVVDYQSAEALAPYKQTPPQRVEDAVRHLISLQDSGGKTFKEWAQNAQVYLDAITGHVPKPLHDTDWQSFKSGLITQKNTISGNAVTKKLYSADELIDEKANTFLQWVLDTENTYKNAQIWVQTVAFMTIGFKILATYDSDKKNHNALDFEDLIAKSRRLLESANQGPWVRYKLDRTLSHLMVDEAQDNDLDQWSILNSLRDEFFAGEGAYEDSLEDDTGARTMFMVGDTKQSIYRFRGAAPQEFARAAARILADAAHAEQEAMEVRLDTSFRSADIILNFVDKLFAEPSRRQCLDGREESLKHHTLHIGTGGYIEVAPLTPPVESTRTTVKEPQDWQLPSQRQNADEEENQQQQHYQMVAKRLKKLIAEAPVLATTATSTTPPRRLRAGDILLLIETKTHAGKLMNALSQQGLVCALTSQDPLIDDGAVADIHYALTFLANPQDDHALAATLRSPLFGFDDKAFSALLTAAKKTGKSLWATLYGSEHIEVVSILKDLLAHADLLTPHGLCLRLLSLTDGRGKLLRAYGGGDTHSPAAGASRLAISALLDWLAEHCQTQNTGLGRVLHDFAVTNPELKSEAMRSPHALRLMTAHGSKGLQAPVVVLPDASYAAGDLKDKILWAKNTTQDDIGCVLKVKKDDASSEHDALLTAEENRLWDDKMRLLYVALTRAEERLYVFGMADSKGLPPARSWYDMIAKTFPETDVAKDGLVQEAQPQFASGVGVLEEDLTPPAKPEKLDLSFIRENLPSQSAPAPLVASSPASRLETVLSPQDRSFQKGVWVHRLLEWLPNFAPDQRQEKAKAYVAQHASKLSPKAQQNMVQTVLDVMAKYPMLFDKNARQELAVTASLNTEKLTGELPQARVDALAMVGQELWVVDFKTDKDVPDVMPEKYQRQLHIYQEVCAQIWPQKTIKAGVLWTSTLEMMWL